MSDDTQSPHDHDHQEQTNTSTPTSSSTTNDNSGQSATQKLMAHFVANRIESAMLLTRLLTILFSIGYVLPLFTTQQSAFNKALLSNAATSALRLHQRLPSFTLSREFLGRLIAEDSFHYLMYSLIFFNVMPTLFIIVPIALFAVLHASSYSLKLLDLIGQNALWGARFLISLVEFQAANILKAAALSEIFLMPMVVVLTFTGKVGLMTPYVYYHFLCMRYRSRRNPYTRNAFVELGMTAETLACRSPPIVAKVIRGFVGFVKRLQPAAEQVPPPAPAAAQ